MASRRNPKSAPGVDRCLGSTERRVPLGRVRRRPRGAAGVRQTRREPERLACERGDRARTARPRVTGGAAGSPGRDARGRPRPGAPLGAVSARRRCSGHPGYDASPGSARALRPARRDRERRGRGDERGRARTRRAPSAHASRCNAREQHPRAARSVTSTAQRAPRQPRHLTAPGCAGSGAHQTPADVIVGFPLWNTTPQVSPGARQNWTAAACLWRIWCKAALPMRVNPRGSRRLE
jgi:hypothetical protein